MEAGQRVPAAGVFPGARSKRVSVFAERAERVMALEDYVRSAPVAGCRAPWRMLKNCTVSAVRR